MAWLQLPPGQMERYFERIELPPSERRRSIADVDDATKLSFLAMVFKHHLIKVPFENLVQHYSWHRVINVHLLRLFRKIVDQPGRGGYCMEVNTFLLTVLLSLGYNCYLVSSRVYAPPNGWGGLTHTVIIVSIGEAEYLIDVGFGPNGPIHPLPLQHNTTTPQISPAESRIVRESLSAYRSHQKVWIYQFRINKEAPWTPVYCILDVELLPMDVEGLNFTPWLDPRGCFTQKIVCVRFTTDAEAQNEPGSPEQSRITGHEIDGTLILDHNKLKWRRRGKDTLNVEFKTEADRVSHLQDYFGIDLDEEDRDAIKYTRSEITQSG